MGGPGDIAGSAESATILVANTLLEEPLLLERYDYYVDRITAAHVLVTGSILHQLNDALLSEKEIREFFLSYDPESDESQRSENLEIKINFRVVSMMLHEIRAQAGMKAALYTYDCIRDILPSEGVDYIQKYFLVIFLPLDDDRLTSVRNEIYDSNGAVRPSVLTDFDLLCPLVRSGIDLNLEEARKTVESKTEGYTGACAGAVLGNEQYALKCLRKVLEESMGMTRITYYHHAAIDPDLASLRDSKAFWELLLPFAAKWQYDCEVKE